jgi:hypothetical protein
VIDPSHGLRTRAAAAEPAGAAWGAPLALVAALGALVVVATFYPGYLNGDPTWQLARARDGFIDDWHPPVMSWVWRSVDRVIAGSGGMFLLQVGMFWTALALIARTVFRRFASAAAAVLLVGWFPPVLALVGTVWKDVQHGAAMALAFALLLRASRTRSLWPIIAAAPPLAYATLLRYNALPAVVPLVGWAVAAALDIHGSRPSRARVAVWTTVAFIALVAGGAAFNGGVTRVRLHTEQHIMLYDLAAISVAHSRNLLPEYLQRRGVTLEEMQRTYTPASSEPFLWMDPARLRSQDGAELRALAMKWQQEVRRHPKDYLVHRTRAYSELLGIGRSVVHFPFFDGSPPTDPTLSALQSDLGVTWERGTFALLVFRALSRVRDSLLFRGWIYLLVDVAALAALARQGRRAWTPAIVLGTSGALYLLAYFFVSPAADFRYNWWGCLAGVLLPIVVVDCWRRERAAIGAESASSPGTAASAA